MVAYRSLVLFAVGLFGSACADVPASESPVGTWVIIADSTRAAEYVTVSRDQTVRDIDTPGTGRITLRHLRTELDGAAELESPIPTLSVVRYLQGFYSLGDAWPPRVLLTDSAYEASPANVYLDVTEPDSTFAVYDYYAPPGVDFWKHVPSWSTPVPPYSVGPDSAVFRNAPFAFRRSGSRYSTESVITANGSLVFARRPLSANQETQFGHGRVLRRPWIYSMRFRPDGVVQMYGGAWWAHNMGNNAVRTGRWTRSETGVLEVDLGGGDVATYRFTVNRRARTMTVVEDTECDRRCQSFFATLLDVRPGTLLDIRTEQTRVLRWEANARPDSLPRPRPPDYAI